MRNPRTIRVACLLLALLFFGAQQHLCSDLAAGGSGSHVCQVCSTVGHAISAHAVTAEFSMVVARWEAPSRHTDSVAPCFRLTASRAPPSL